MGTGFYGRSPWLSLWGRLSAEDNERVNVAMSQTRRAIWLTAG